MALADEIKKLKHRPVRKLYIKRRDTSGNHEASWVRIDRWKNRSRVIDWGGGSEEIDEQPGLIGAFDVSELVMTVDNSEGHFNVETYFNSIWNGYLNRRYTKLKIDTAYLDVDGSEVGEATSFEGFIDQVIIDADNLATLTVLSYQAVLARYPIDDLSLSGNMTVNAVVTAIMNQSKITNFIPYVVPAAGVNYTISAAQNLTGTYWDVLQVLANHSDSICLLQGSVFNFKERTPSVGVVWSFAGAGSDDPENIMLVNSYDDEGIGKIRVYWYDSDSGQTAITADATLQKKYLAEPEIIDLSNFNSSADQLSVLQALLARWENSIPVIEFETKYLINQISLLDRITIEIRGQLTPTPFTWGAWVWGDGSVWGRETGGIIIPSSVEWMVTKIYKNIEDWKFTIRAEKIIS